jgi:hypothetical protein
MISFLLTAMDRPPANDHQDDCREEHDRGHQQNQNAAPQGTRYSWPTTSDTGVTQSTALGKCCFAQKRDNGKPCQQTPHRGVEPDAEKTSNF